MKANPGSPLLHHIFSFSTARMDESQLVAFDVFLAELTPDANTTSPSQTHDRNSTVPIQTNPSTGWDYSQVLPSNENPFIAAFSNSEVSGLRNYDTNASNHSMSRFQPPSILGEGGNNYLRAQQTYASYTSPMRADNSQSSDHQSYAYVSRSPTTSPSLPHSSHQYHGHYATAQGVYSNHDLQLPGGTASPFQRTGMPFSLVNPGDYSQSFSHPSLGVRHLRHTHTDQSNIPANSAWNRVPAAPQAYEEPGQGYSGHALALWTVGTQSPHNSLSSQPYNQQMMFASQGQFYGQMGAQTAGSSSVHSSSSTGSTNLPSPQYTSSRTGNPLPHGAYRVAHSEPAASYSNTQDHKNSYISLFPYKRSQSGIHDSSAPTLPDDYGLADVATYSTTEEQNDPIPNSNAVPEPPNTHGPTFRPAPGTVGPQDMWNDLKPCTCPFPECNLLFSRDEAQAHFNSVHLAGQLEQHSQCLKTPLPCTIEPCRRGADRPIQLITMWRHFMTHAEFRYCCSWDGCNQDYAQDHAACRHFREMHWGWPNGKTPSEFRSLGGSSAAKKRKRT